MTTPEGERGDAAAHAATAARTIMPGAPVPPVQGDAPSLRGRSAPSRRRLGVAGLLVLAAGALTAYVATRDGSTVDPRIPVEIGAWSQVSAVSKYPGTKLESEGLVGEYQRPGESSPSLRVSAIGNRTGEPRLTDELIRAMFEKATREEGVYLEPSAAVDARSMGGALRCTRHQGYTTDNPGPVHECVGSNARFTLFNVTFLGPAALEPVDPVVIEEAALAFAASRE